jgi:Trk K+ transport system NAD-binding subunit
MHIIIVGAGKVGGLLVEQLAQEGHRVVSIDHNEKKLLELQNSFDVLCLIGRATNAKLLAEAGAASADLVIAATDSDEANMLCCLLAKRVRDVETIARIRAAEKKNQSDVERQNSASSQLRYWETQMNSVYQTIMSVLSTEEAAVLARDQQDWKKQREQNAAEAARNLAGSRQESTEYTLSQAEATRERAYELLERYRDRL